MNASSKVKTSSGTSEEFGIRVGVHQGSPLSPLLFMVVMEEATRGERRGFWELLYSDDLVVQQNLEKKHVIGLTAGGGQWRGEV